MEEKYCVILKKKKSKFLVVNSLVLLLVIRQKGIKSDFIIFGSYANSLKDNTNRYLICTPYIIKKKLIAVLKISFLLRFIQSNVRTFSVFRVTSH